MTTLWETNGSELIKALGTERRSAGAVTSGLALTLVVVVDEKHVREAEEAATVAAAMHPFRLLVVVRRQLEAESRLDAEVQAGGRLGPGEAVVMRMYGRLSLHAESVVLPLLAPDAPVVTWWHGEPPRHIAHDPLGVLAGRRITDCAKAPDPLEALRGRADDYAPGDTDLAWTRITGWRGLVASAFDSATGRATGGTVAAEPGNPSAALLAGWLTVRLGVPVEVVDSRGPGITEVRLPLDDGNEIWLERGDGQTATVHRAGMLDLSLPLPRRDLGDVLAEELRRLDPDRPYGAALGAATGRDGLADRDPVRVHEWFDPANPPTHEPEPALLGGEQPKITDRAATAARSVAGTAVKAARKTVDQAAQKPAQRTAEKTQDAVRQPTKRTTKTGSARRSS